MGLFDEELCSAAGDEASSAPPKPGTYGFKVDSVEETTFSTGSEGYKVTLLVNNGDKDMTVFTNLVKTPKAAWKISEFCKSLGLVMKDVGSPLEFMNKMGEAEFGLKKYDGQTYLEPKKFIPADDVSF